MKKEMLVQLFGMQSKAGIGGGLDGGEFFLLSSLRRDLLGDIFREILGQKRETS